jgi:hypothetical protein
MVQALAYGGIILLTILTIAFIFKGFFWKYIKVKTGQGKYLLVKIRNVVRDHYAVGWIDEGFLIFKSNTPKDKCKLRLALTDKNAIYRSLGVNWIDIDEEKNAICNVNYTPVSGFDSKKFSDLLTRALMRPAITSGQEKIILICVILGVLLGLVSVFLLYKNYTLLQNMPTLVAKAVGQTILNSKGIITPGASI